jgi:hypothetical protein
MKQLVEIFRSSAAVVMVAAATLLTQAWGQTAPQSVSISPGWNAIWLEVQPTYGTGHPKAGMAMAPEDVFINPAITIVASPKELAGTAEFFGNTPEDLDPANNFNQDEWLQWKRSDPADISNLTMMFGNRPYLVFSTASTPISQVVTGKVRFFRPQWNADRYNLIGFGLEGTRTFSQFFAAAGTSHPLNKMFTLNANGSWVPVSPSTVMVSGRAYWIFSSGPSSYMGPVALDYTNAVSGIFDFGGVNDVQAVGSEQMDLKELVITNIGTDAATPSATTLSADPAFSLFRVTPATNNLSYVRGNGFASSFVAIPGKNTMALTVGARRTFTDSSERINVYRIRASATGASVYLPVRAVLSDVEQTAAALGVLPSAPMSGLWVGNVIMDKVTSIVVNGAPVQNTSTTAPMRLILHVNGSGQVRLLSQVTMMQTKSADPSVPNLPVLVVDPAKIPFFEGIKERNGKRVGVRIESSTYDMPRSASAWTGPDLLTLSNRPTALQEVYDLTRLMSGTMGQTLTTSFVIDPFHRSNPMRHAYHQELTKGPKITRTFTLAFDAQQPKPDQLSGTFTEVINGLIKDNLTVSGRINMNRISTVPVLDNAP